MEELLSLLPELDLRGVLSVPVIMLVTAISVAMLVVTLKALILFIIRLVHRTTQEKFSK
mgnify:FL=1